ncbi:hypothetical protein EOD41_00605 [Mucilaginibacter limnophilus]|uniref:Uncharacterized protein n=1 Tax=Mucilaginibacter limnophilus TaxID=1932778 RepID=A0A3S2V3K7_9SPHI|nr:hypothetical protein [Mucilaginibacter limnophilus]RVU02474.1 hypothetical protein EOD41_00605 [Mucilaginibacter limnophilus]
MNRNIGTNTKQDNGKYIMPGNHPVRKFYHTSAKMLTLIFNYHGKMHQTKAMVTYANGLKLYKIALYSKLNECNAVCWLQKSGSIWQVVIGQIDADLREELIKAIELREESSAIHSIGTNYHTH